MSVKSRLPLLGLLFLWGTLFPIFTATALQVSFRPRMEQDWIRYFQNSKGWNGGDGIRSVNLRDGRILWLFGDSWIGEIARGQHLPGSTLVNSAIAITPFTRGGATPPGKPLFFWGHHESGAPMALVIPDPVAVPPHLKKPISANFFWLAGDALLLPGSEGEALYHFAFHIGKTSDESVWGFKSVGQALLKITNPHAPAEQFVFQQFDLPHAVATDFATREHPERTFGNAIHHSPGGNGHPGWVYLFGVEEGNAGQKRLILSRCPETSLVEFDRWQFLTSEGWSRVPEDLAILAEDMVNEFSVIPWKFGREWWYLLIQSENHFGTGVQVRIARQLEGPWSHPVTVFQVPGVKGVGQRFTYAAKAHPHLSAPGRLLVSYVINTHDFAELCADASIYQPLFFSFDPTPLLDLLHP